MQHRRPVALLATLATGAACVAVAAPRPAQAQILPISFDKPVQLTTDPVCGGYEPGMTVDHFGNIVVTAHKDNHCLALSTDPSGALPVRSQSWLWTSKDGVSFTDMPGLTALGVDRMDFGDEGDLTHDDTGHVYFVDTKVTDNSFTRWKSDGPGAFTEEFTTPAMGTAEPVDDRPWIVAHGDGTVLYLGNEGDKITGLGGRYLAYMSYDGGATFAHVGTPLPDSGWCRPAADHRPGSRLLYAICTNDSGSNDQTDSEGDPAHTKGTLYSFVSADDGKSWTRYPIDSYNGNDNTGNTRNINEPGVQVDSNGVIYALFNNNDTTGQCQCDPADVAAGTSSGVTITGNHLILYRSTDQGRTWQKREITPHKGLYHYSDIDVAADGSIGVAYYSALDNEHQWFVYAGTARSWDAPFTFASLAPGLPVLDKGGNSSALGDLFNCRFGPDNRLNVVWARSITPPGGFPLKGDMYFSRQVGGTEHPLPSLPLPSLPLPLPPVTGVAGLANTSAASPDSAWAAGTAASVIALLVLGTARRRRPAARP